MTDRSLVASMMCASADLMVRRSIAYPMIVDKCIVFNFYNDLYLCFLLLWHVSCFHDGPILLAHPAKVGHWLHHFDLQC